MEKQIGSLKVIYNDEDYVNPKLKRLEVTIITLLIMFTVLILCLVAAYFMDKNIPEDAVFTQFITAFVFAIIVVCGCVIPLFTVSRIIYHKKQGIYDLLNLMKKMENFNICINMDNESVFFRVDYKNSSAQYYGQSYIHRFLDIKKEEAKWNINFNEVFKGKNILEIDVTKYPNVTFSVKTNI